MVIVLMVMVIVMIVVVTAIVVKDGKYLITRRSPLKKRFGGMWTVPGGKLETSDYVNLPKDTAAYWYNVLEQVLRREVKEETQLEILSEPVLVYAQDIIPNEEKHVVRLSYVGKTKGEPVLDTSENIEYKWLSLDALKSQDDMDVYAKEILDKGYLDRV